jgi:hypothetical protein
MNSRINLLQAIAALGFTRSQSDPLFNHPLLPRDPVLFSCEAVVPVRELFIIHAKASKFKEIYLMEFTDDLDNAIISFVNEC